MFAMCSWPSLCEQSELQCWRRNRGERILGGQARVENPTRLCPRALTMFAICSWPSLCEQSELQCWRRNRRLCEPALISAARELLPNYNISIFNTPPITPRAASDVSHCGSWRYRFMWCRRYFVSFQVAPSFVSFTSKPNSARRSRIWSLVAQSLAALALARSSSRRSMAWPKLFSRSALPLSSA